MTTEKKAKLEKRLADLARNASLVELPIKNQETGPDSFGYPGSPWACSGPVVNNIIF